MSVRDDKTITHNVNSARSVGVTASSVFSSRICRLKQPPFTLLVDGNNLTIRPNADDALQAQSYPPSPPERSAGFRALDGFSPYDNEQRIHTRPSAMHLHQRKSSPLNSFP